MAKGKAKDKSWYQKGKAGAKRAGEMDAAAQARRDAKGPLRFWLETSSEAKVTFLDNPQFFLSEHNLKLGGKWHNFFTCIQELDTCPLCESGDNPGYVVVGTVINHKTFTDRDGKEHKNQKMLFVGKGKARQKLLKQIERREEDLKFCVYLMSRGPGSTECATGEDFEYLKRLTKTQLKKLIPEGEKEDWLEPFDYEKIFEPKSAEELRKIVGGAAPVGSEEENGDGNGKEEKKGEEDEAEPSTEDGELSIDDLI